MLNELLSSRINIGIIVLVFIVGGCLLSFMFTPFIAWGLACAFLCGGLLIGRPRLMLALYFVGLSFLGYLDTVVSNVAIRYFDEFCIFAITVILMGNFVLLHKKFSSDLKYMSRLVKGLFLIIILSAVINRVSLNGGIRFLLAYMGFIPVFYLCQHYLREKDGKVVVFAVPALLIIQLGMNLGWYVGLNPLPNWAAGGVDFAIGTLGSSTPVAYLSIAVCLMSLALILEAKKLKLKWLFIGIGLLSVFELFLTYTNHAVLLLGFCLLLEFVYVIKHRKKLLVIAVSLCLIVGFILFLDSSSLSRKLTGSTSIRNELSTRNLARRWNRIQYGVKGEVIRNVVFRAPRDMPVPVLGGGPGNFASSIGVQMNRYLARKYVNYFFLTYSGRIQLIGGSITQQVVTGLVAIWSELGPIGVLLFFGMHIYAFFHIALQLRKGLYANLYQRVIAMTFVPLMFLILVVNAMADMLHMDFLQCGVWALAGFSWTPFTVKDRGKDVSDVPSGNGNNKE